MSDVTTMSTDELIERVALTLQHHMVEGTGIPRAKSLDEVVGADVLRGYARAAIAAMRESEPAKDVAGLVGLLRNRPASSWAELMEEAADALTRVAAERDKSWNKAIQAAIHLVETEQPMYPDVALRKLLHPK